MSEQRSLKQDYNGHTVEHVLVHDGGGGARATVLIVPTVMGVSPLELGFAEQLSGLGYNSVVADLFGKRFTPVVDREEAFGAMNALLADRAALRDRLVSILELTKDQAEVDAGRVAVIGYCFGGLCTLDLARSGADFVGAATFHGLFNQPGLPPNPIKPKVVAFHGWNDPMVPPEDVVALGQELTAAGADWQIHAYGHVGHGFTNPRADQIGIQGVFYHEAAARRSWASLVDFLAEVLG